MPTPPKLAETRRSAPGLVDVIHLEGVGRWGQQKAEERVNAELIKFLAVTGMP